MAGHKTYEESIRAVYWGLFLLGAVTLVEVFISLVGKGHVFGEVTSSWLLAIIALLLIGLSIYKAYFIVYEFMHMAHEVKGLAMTVLLPTLLLVWAIIAFFSEGNYWKERRNDIQEREAVEPGTMQESLLEDDVYIPKLI